MTLKHAQQEEQERRRRADSLVVNIKEEKRLLFEEQKRVQAELLAQKMKDTRQNVITSLHHKMKKFDEEVSVDKIVEQLLTVAKSRVCR